MKKGLAIMLGGDEESEAEAPEKGMDVQNEERRSVLRSFFQAAQNGDIEAGMKAWARMGECGPPEVQSGGEDEPADEDIGPEEKPRKPGIYRD